MKEKLDLPGWEVIPNKLDPSKSIYMHDGKLSSFAEYQEALTASESNTSSDITSDVVPVSTPEFVNEKKGTTPSVSEADLLGSKPKRGRPRKEDIVKTRTETRKKKDGSHAFYFQFSDEEYRNFNRVKALMTIEDGQLHTNEEVFSMAISYFLRRNNKQSI